MDIKELFRKYLNDEASGPERSMVEDWVSALFGKMQSGTASAEETELVHQWLEQFNLKESDIKILSEKVDRDKSEVWNNIRKQQSTGEKDNSGKKSISVFFKYAAVLALMLIITVLVYNKSRDKETAGIHKTITRDDSIRQLACNKGESAKSFTLPDGSLIYLNSNSVVTYVPGRYNVSSRIVKLEKGLAFFEVKKDPARAFMVQTKNLTITVTGTSFEVCADPAINKSSVSVKSGSVAVSRDAKPLATLHAGQALTLKPDNITFEVSQAPGTVAKWASGEIIFSNAGITDIKNIIENRFNKSVANKSSKLNSSIKFNATFGSDATIAEIAASVASLYNVHYSIVKDSVVFY